MSNTVSPTLHFDNTLGALLLGGLFAMALWGTACSQTYTYFAYRFQDPRYTKLVVIFLWLLDTFESALNAHILYAYLVTNYLDTVTLSEPTWSVRIHFATATISNFIIRAMFIERVFFLSSRNIWLTTWLMATSLSDLVVDIVITIKSFSVNSYTLTYTISDLIYLTFALGIVCDTSLAVTLCWFLHRSRTGFEKTDSMIFMLMTYTVNTSIIVAIDASVGMVMYIMMPKNLIFFGFYLLSSKLYLNAYLATLNARAKLRFRREDMATIPLSQISECRYAVESSSPIVEKESNNTLQVDTRRISVPISAGHVHDRTVDGRGSLSTIMHQGGSSSAV